jgi:formate--tetrahydrofolate ligase
MTEEKTKKTFQSDLEIAQSVSIVNISEIAKKIGIHDYELEMYGKYKAKIDPVILERLKDRDDGKYIFVTCITPTPLGEGKTVNTIGLSMGLNKIGKKAICCIRQPSLGPTFGIKGGAAGGGWSQVLPMEDFNLHFTGDTHAVTTAHNLLSAFVDNSIHQGNPLNIDPKRIKWKRVLDISDRVLRNIVVGLGGKSNGITRECGFDITPASEVMTILSLTTGLKDMRKRLGQIVIGYNYKGKPVTAEDLQCAGAMAVLMKDAIKPNLVQTIEHTPCLVHSGPFANIATGNSSVLADRIAIKCADYVVTECGFGADMGAEKLINIKCRQSGLKPSAALLVCSIRALKSHSGKYKILPGKPLDPSLLRENLEDLKLGICNLEKQIENIKIYNIPVVVAINRFTTDTENEINLVIEAGKKAGAYDVVVSEAFLKGGEGSVDMARAIVKAAETESNCTQLYSEKQPVMEKIEIIAKKLYGAASVKYMRVARKQIKTLTELGFGNLPVCMAKTPLSLSHIPSKKGRPEGFELPVREVGLSAGAGFLYILLGNIMTMPGLPSIPGGTRVDLDENGKITGLF